MNCPYCEHELTEADVKRLRGQLHHAMVQHRRGPTGPQPKRWVSRPCKKCGDMQPTARMARDHCRKKRKARKHDGETNRHHG